MAHESSYKRTLQTDLYEDSSDPETSPPSSKSRRGVDPDDLEEQRLRVNSRERQRMHDMNGAMDALRAVMPYAQGPAVKKLSKMNTLLLARNYILLLSRSIEETRRLLGEGHHQLALPRDTRLVSAGQVPSVLDPTCLRAPGYVLPQVIPGSPIPLPVRTLPVAGIPAALCPLGLSRDHQGLLVSADGKSHSVLSCPCQTCLNHS